MPTQWDSRAAWICTAEQLRLYPHVTNVWWQICLKIFLSLSLLELIQWVWLDSELCLWEPVLVTASLLQERKGWLSGCRKPLQLDLLVMEPLPARSVRTGLVDSCKMSCYTLCCWAVPVVVRRPFQAHLDLCLSLAPLDCTPSLALSFVKSHVFTWCSSLGLTTFFTNHSTSEAPGSFSIYETFPLGLTAAGKHTDSHLINSCSLQGLSKTVKLNEVSDFLFSCCTGGQNYPHAGLKGTIHSRRSSYLINFLETLLTKFCAHSFLPVFFFLSIQLTTKSMGDCTITGLHTWSRCLFSASFIENSSVVVFFFPSIGEQPRTMGCIYPCTGILKYSQTWVFKEKKSSHFVSLSD